MYSIIITHIPCVPVQIRAYSSTAHNTIAEEKIALVIGPIAFTKQEAYIEASTLVPIAGDPADPRYEETVPDLLYPYLIGVGHVVGTDTMSAAETSSYVNVNVTDYVKDQYMASSVRYAFSLNTTKY